MIKDGRHWEVIDDEKVQCNVCPRHCILREGKRGFCFVRQNVGHKMVLTTYGRGSGFCIDPIEKKPLNHYYPGTSVLSFGTAGCNLGCRFCQNWDISTAREFDKLQEEATPHQIADMAKATGCNSVAFTYNDPTIFFLEYAVDTAKACHDIGLNAVAVSAGYITIEAAKDLYGSMDAANIDLKAFTQEFYKKLCFANLEPVLDILIFLKEKTNVWFEVTTLLIPGQNDSEEEVSLLSKWMKKELGPDVPLHFSAFHPDYKMLDTPPTPPKTLTRARNIALSNGLRYVYTGNVYDTRGGSTYCPKCDKQIIERNWYELGEYHIKNGKCAFCKTKIPGHFANTPGSWGRRRHQVSF